MFGFAMIELMISMGLIALVLFINEFPDYAAAFYGLSPEAAKNWQDTGNVDIDLK